MENCKKPTDNKATEYFTTYREDVYNEDGNIVGELEMYHQGTELIINHNNGKRYILIESYKKDKYIIVGKV